MLFGRRNRRKNRILHHGLQTPVSVFPVGAQTPIGPPPCEFPPPRTSPSQTTHRRDAKAPRGRRMELPGTTVLPPPSSGRNANGSPPDARALLHSTVGIRWLFDTTARLG